jgi:putative flippase GtrA
MTSIATQLSSKEFQRFTRFLTVGAIGTFLDFSLLSLLKALGLPTLVANSVSFTAGVINNFTWNRLWTFSDEKQADWQRQLAQFLLVSLVGLTLNNAIVLLLEALLGGLLGHPDYGYLPAKVIATGVVVFWNYFANRYWTSITNRIRAERSAAYTCPGGRCQGSKRTSTAAYGLRSGRNI